MLLKQNKIDSNLIISDYQFFSEAMFYKLTNLKKHVYVSILIMYLLQI